MADDIKERVQVLEDGQQDVMTFLRRIERLLLINTSTLDDVRDDVRYMRPQLMSLKAEVRAIPTAVAETIVETVRASEKKITAAVADALASSETRTLRLIGDTEQRIRQSMAESTQDILAAIKDLKKG